MPSSSSRPAPTPSRSSSASWRRARGCPSSRWKRRRCTRSSSTWWGRRRCVRKIWAVIRREFVERVRSKWFWVSAILGPLFFAAIVIIPLHFAAAGGTKAIVVVDGTTSGFGGRVADSLARSEEHTSELQSRLHLVCRLLLEKKKKHESAVIDARSAS